MSNRSIKYSKDSKKTIIKLYREEKRSASSLANEYGVTVSTTTKWIHQYQEVSLPNNKIVTTEGVYTIRKGKPRVKRRT